MRDELRDELLFIRHPETSILYHVLTNMSPLAIPRLETNLKFLVYEDFQIASVIPSLAQSTAIL
jgi:hypothetical protein